MAAKKTPVAKQTATETNDDIARKIWLAGVGAYGRVFQEAQGRAQKVAGEAGKAFDQLVATGEAVEHIVRAKIAENEQAQKVAGMVEQIDDFRAERRAALEARVKTVGKAVNDTIAPFNPLTLHRQIADLTTRVAALEAQLGAAKPAAKKAPAKRARG